MQPDKMTVFHYTFSCYELIAWICFCGAAELVPRAVPSPLGPARWGSCVFGSVPHTEAVTIKAPPLQAAPLVPLCHGKAMPLHYSRA